MTDFDSLIQVAGDTAAGKTSTETFVEYLTQWLTQVNDNELELLVGAILVLAQPEVTQVPTDEQIRDAYPFAEVEPQAPTLYNDVRRLLERAFIPEPIIHCIMVLVAAGEIKRDSETEAVSATAAEAEAQFWGECLKEINKPVPAAVKVRARRAPVGECPTCDSYRNAGIKHHPSHEAAPRCESGGRPHCTCDVCF